MPDASAVTTISLQEFGPDLMAEPARSTVNRDNDVIPREPEGLGDGRIEDVRDRLHLEIMVAGTERAHLPALAFLGPVGNVAGLRPCHTPFFLDPIEVTRFTQPARPPNGRRLSAWHPCRSASSVIAPLLPTPAGI